MPTSDCCRNVIQPDDHEAMLISVNRRTLRLCKEHARLIVAMLADLQIEPPVKVIQ